MAYLAFCKNCGSDDLRIGAQTAAGIEVTCYKCTKRSVLVGIMLGEIDFLAGAQAKVAQMIERAKQKARGQSGQTTRRSEQR